ncbi:ATP-dependent endonuclease [Paenisporosarcina macmurdoensis]|uniref:ATP-dependent endonuclease n=1 Tax=Paenisporosarcina macmurdoensis TaxID=212659 RepID=A0ABW1L9P6_9BACL
MKLQSFSVENYKIFKENFTLNINESSIVILTGRNNTGKSTLLEAINWFFKKETKSNTIPIDCYTDEGKEIIFRGKFGFGEESFTFTKKYSNGSTPKFFDDQGIEIKASHQLRANLDVILSNDPFYITPAMSIDDLNSQVQNIYSEATKNKIQEIENATFEDEDVSEEHKLKKEYEELKLSIPKFVTSLKKTLDESLRLVSGQVSVALQRLFSNDSISLKISGGESGGISSSEIVKSMKSNLFINQDERSDMHLSNQGTGLQRMTLIYLIQNMIDNNLIGNRDDKMLLIDEPEAFLHPEAVRALSDSLYQIGREMPLIISTHSPILINLEERHTSIQIFRVGQSDAIELYKSDTEKFDDDDFKNLKILNYVDSYVNEFFFADNILIVEGDTEYIAFNQLVKMNKDNLHIIRAKGKSTVATLMKILNQFQTKYTVLHDSDNNPDFSISTLRAQLTNCKSIFANSINEDVNIYSSVHTFEVALGLGSISGSNKTRKIYEIMNDDSVDTEISLAKEKIKSVYNVILCNNEERTLPDGFHKIETIEDYERLFNPMIEAMVEQA